MNFKIKHQLDGSVIPCHADNIRKAKVDTWEIPEPSLSLRKTAYVVPPETDTSSSSEDSSEDNVPLARLAQRYRHEREDSESEGPIPKMELAKHRCHRKNWYEDDSDSSSDS